MLLNVRNVSLHDPYIAPFQLLSYIRTLLPSHLRNGKGGLSVTMCDNVTHGNKVLSSI